MWAERRKLETHPKTGAAQIVEIRERIEEIFIPKYIQVEAVKPPKPKLFTKYADEQLLSYGVPEEWLADVRDADEDSILEVAEHLPAEAAEAMLEIAVGKAPVVIDTKATVTDPFQHPDALRRFRVMITSRNWRRRWIIPGKNGLYFCTLHNGNGLNAVITARRGFQVRLEPVKRLLRCIGQYSLPVTIQIPGYC